MGLKVPNSVEGCTIPTWCLGTKLRQVNHFLFFWLPMLLKFVQFGGFGERIRRRLPFLSSDLDNFGDPAGLGMCRLSPCIRHFTLLWEGLPLSDSPSSLGRQQAPGEALRSRFVRVRRCFIEADHTDQLPTQGLFHIWLMNRRNIHHRPALLWRFSWLWRRIQNWRLTYLLTRSTWHDDIEKVTDSKVKVRETFTGEGIGLQSTVRVDFHLVLIV